MFTTHHHMRTLPHAPQPQHDISQCLQKGTSGKPCCSVHFTEQTNKQTCRNRTKPTHRTSTSIYFPMQDHTHSVQLRFPSNELCPCLEQQCCLHAVGDSMQPGYARQIAVYTTEIIWCLESRNRGFKCCSRKVVTCQTSRKSPGSHIGADGLSST